MTALVRSELRQRMRGKRWWLLLLLWTLVLYGLVWLVYRASLGALAFLPRPVPIGPAMFGSLALFLLLLVCLVMPALTATSINAERDRGTLAVLQATLYRPWEIVAAKFLSAFLTACAFIAASLPLAAWAFSEEGVGWGRGVAVYAVLLVVAAVLIVIALAASALLRRAAASAVVSYLVVFALVLGTPIVFGLLVASAPASRSGESLVGWRWVVLAPNPAVVLADAAPRSAEESLPDPLTSIRNGVRALRSPAPSMEIVDSDMTRRYDEPGAVWPLGLVMELSLAALAAYATVRRLQVPARRLAPGERVA